MLAQIECQSKQQLCNYCNVSRTTVYNVLSSRDLAIDFYMVQEVRNNLENDKYRVVI